MVTEHLVTGRDRVLGGPADPIAQNWTTENIAYEGIPGQEMG